jgi:hypothetical protein
MWFSLVARVFKSNDVLTTSNMGGFLRMPAGVVHEAGRRAKIRGEVARPEGLDTCRQIAIDQ